MIHALIFLAIAGFCTCIIAIIENNASIAALYIALITPSAIILKAKRCETLDIFSATVLAGIIFSVALHYVYLERYGTPFYVPGQDDIIYERDAKYTALKTSPFEYSPLSTTYDMDLHNSPGYVYLLSLVVRFGKLIDDHHPLLAKIVNSILIGFIAVTTASIAKQIGLSQSKARLAAITTGLFPMMLFIAAHTYRDVLAALLLVCATSLILKAQDTPRKNWNPINFFLVGLLFIAMLEIRKVQAIAILGGVLVVGAGGLMSAKIPLRLLYLILISAILTWAALLEKNAAIELAIIALDQVYQYQTIASEHTSGITSIIFNQTFPANIVARYLYASIFPIPMIYENIELSFVSIGSIIQFAFYPFLLLGAAIALKDRQKRVIATTFLIIFFGYFMGSFLFRHLAQVIPFASILIITAFNAKNNAHKTIVAFTMTTGILLAITTIYISF